MNPVERELLEDNLLLDAVESGGPAVFRTWTVAQPTVVVGRAVVIEEEVDEHFCHYHAVTIVRRQSGGRSVLVGPGTLQYTFALPYRLSDELSTIDGSKRFCNRTLIPALSRARTESSTLTSVPGAPSVSDGAISQDKSGDLVVDGCKVAGLALRRRRTGMLLHGTILVGADLDMIASALRHPKQEPAYRGGRSHTAFLRNLGSVDETLLARDVNEQLRALTATAAQL